MPSGLNLDTPQTNAPFKSKNRTLVMKSVFAIFAASTLIVTVNAHASQSVTQKQAISHSYHIPAGSLGQSLARFAVESGIALSFDPTLTGGLRSQGLSGEYSIQEAVQRLLEGTGLLMVSREDGSYTLIQVSQEGVTLAPLSVMESLPVWGSAESGYVHVGTTPIGPWEGRDLLDTPYSVNVVSHELIQNMQATSSDQVFKMNPVTQLHWPQTQNDSPYVSMRGFTVPTHARNGISRQKWNFAHGTTMEEVERMEVLTGLSGFLYGGGNVGGIVNFVTKRPTHERLNSITLGNTGGQNHYVHGDFGGRIDDAGRFGYRINAVAQDGETRIKHQTNQRTFISGAFDWQVTDNLLLEFDALRRDYRLEGRQAYWYLAPGVERPKASQLDSTKTWGQKWTMQDIESQRVGLNARWEASDNITVRAGYLKEFNSRSSISASNTIESDGTYSQRITVSEHAPQKIHGTGFYGYSDFAFNTGNIQHRLTLGLQMSDSIREDHPDGGYGNDYKGFSLESPTYFDKPASLPHGTLPTFSRYDLRTKTLTIGDDIAFNEKWSALVGLSHSQIGYRDYNVAGDQIAHYDESEITPTVSLLYKPQPNVTTYISYMEGLEQGGVAGETFGSLDVVNANAVLGPLVSQQVEAGVKGHIGGMLLTAAVFNIDKPFEYYHTLNNTQARFVQDGRQVHRGLELTATGRLTDRLTLVGGMTLLDAKIKKNQQNPQLEGNRPEDVATQMFKLYGEYDLPVMQGLTLTGGISHTGKRFGNNTNTDQLPAYTLADIGARYVLNPSANPLTLRLNVNNLTDQRYWVNRNFLGDARTIVFSANVNF